MAWWDFFQVFQYAFTDDALTKRNRRVKTGAAYSQPESIPNNYSTVDSPIGGSSAIRLRDTKELVDLSTVTNRIHRYKEYERLRDIGEIETAMTVFADEACFSGDERVMTPHGPRTLKDLAENEKDKFLCYCYDFEKGDYTLGWAYAARKTKTAMTVRVILDSGDSFICTPDHRILMKNEQWQQAGNLTTGDELMPFYRISANHEITESKINQFPRIYTKNKGWIHERQFVDEWRTGRAREDLKDINRYCRMIAEGLSVRQIQKLTGRDLKTIVNCVKKHGFSNKELKWLGNKPDHRRVVAVLPHKEIDVYDISVEKYQNFATTWGIAHNCQRDDDGRVFEIHTSNDAVKEELEFLWFHRQMLNFDQKTVWNLAKQLFIFGDYFAEVVIDIENPSKGIQNLVPLPPESMYRIETTKGKLIEFQQSKDGPDYESLANVDITHATEQDLERAKAIRFRPEQVIHIRIGDDRKTFYPYGVSLIEPARGPAHQLRLMEDAMLVYRLTRAPERRVFYIDVHDLPSHKAEAFIERMKDHLKKKKVSGRNGMPGASSVEERWHAPAADEDFWIPIRSNSNTRVETLPGAQNLGEVDDTLYFRNKLFTALNFPRNYFNNEDTQSTRVSLSALDTKFARLVERLQSHIEDAFWEVSDRHLRLLGYPEESYDDLVIKFTPPSDWRELTRAEVKMNRLNAASTLKGSQLMSDYDILTKELRYSDEEAQKMLARLKIQKLEELKLQIIAQNPTIVGVGLPGPNETEVGTEPGGPSPMLNPDQGMAQPLPNEMPAGAMGMRKYMDDDGGEDANPMANMQGMQQNPPSKGSGIVLPEPTEEDIQKMDLEIKDFEKEMDEEEQDASESE